MTDTEWLARQFEQWRPHLGSVAYRMLGSLTEAEDAVQETWLRLHRSDTEDIVDLHRWLTTVVARICLDRLRVRRASREDYVGSWLPEPVVVEDQSTGPEHEAILADSVGLAMLIVLEALTPTERLSFVLHDVFGVPFSDVADIVGCTVPAARQLASRARRRLRDAPQPEPDLAVQRRVVDAFLAAARTGDMEALIAVLDPDVVFRADTGADAQLAQAPITGVDAVVRHVLASAPHYLPFSVPAIVNGQAGAVFSPEAPRAVIGFTVSRGKITAIDIIADPEKLTHVRIDAR